ncbi:MAG TPA: DUF4276 family protein, partial [Saprospiraceae bacterium]|nr:DUF4276 family protein [Saprospiraceae bacterium]
YIQLYEFEALLFSDASIFDSQFDKSEILDYEYLRETLQTPPEEINEGPATAPSKRLEKIIEGYNKVLHGSLIAHVIGLDIIRGKCSRFNSWVETLENI